MKTLDGLEAYRRDQKLTQDAKICNHARRREASIGTHSRSARMAITEAPDFGKSVVTDRHTEASFTLKQI
jgi:hypothetical protein